jgi:hypothetical protein
VEILNLGGSEESSLSAPKSRKSLRVLLGIGALAAVTGIGSTLAANISLNNDTSVEFGQGVVTTAACDGTITVTPISEFTNDINGGGEFYLTSVDLSDIDSACDTKTLTVKGYDDTDPNSKFSVDVISSAGTAQALMSASTILAEDIYKITIESSDGV